MVAQAAEFRTRLTQVKHDTAIDFEWYPYDSLSNVAVLNRLLDGGVDLNGRDVLDIGCADGDLSFFLESQGAKVYAVDHPQTNHNGMRGVRALKQALGSSVEILETDLDVGFQLPQMDFTLVVALGLLYHLKNPFYFLETLSRAARHCVLSTRVARYLPDRKTDISGVPVAYLVGSQELNDDDSNYWILSESCLRQLLRRTNWRVRNWIPTGDVEAPDPVSPDHDGRVYCLLESSAGLKNLELRSGWHEPEGPGWRWTERCFTAVLPRDSVLKTPLYMQFYLHADILRATGPLTISCTANGRRLEPATYSNSGNHVFQRELPKDGASCVEVSFELSGALKPEPQDPRERGIIVASLTAED